MDKATSISVDVSFDTTSGLDSVEFISQALRKMPTFRPLLLVLKYFLYSRGLSETFMGGIGSYLLQLMIISHIQVEILELEE